MTSDTISPKPKLPWKVLIPLGIGFWFLYDFRGLTSDQTMSLLVNMVVVCLIGWVSGRFFVVDCDEEDNFMMELSYDDDEKFLKELGCAIGALCVAAILSFVYLTFVGVETWKWCLVGIVVASYLSLKASQMGD